MASPFYERDDLFYKDKKGLWRWTIKSKNGKIIGASSQGFKRKESAQRNMKAVWHEFHCIFNNI